MRKAAVLVAVLVAAVAEPRAAVQEPVRQVPALAVARQRAALAVAQELAAAVVALLAAAQVAQAPA